MLSVQYNEPLMRDDVYQILHKKYEKIMKTSYYGDYALGLTSNVKEELNNLYIITFPEHTKPSGILSSCSACSLKGIKRLASAYFRYKEELNKTDEQIMLLNEVFEDEVSNELEPNDETPKIKVVRKNKRK